MITRWAWRVARSVNRRCLLRLARMGWQGMAAARRYKRQAARDAIFPPFVFLSLTTRCNLRCVGCWVTVGDEPLDMPAETVHRVINEAKAQGNRFFGILGGEPLLHPDWRAILAAHPECYFQLFTNGVGVTEEVAAYLARLGNVTPLVSLEGLGAEGDRRRGGEEVHARALAGLEHLLRAGLFVGVASSICQGNYKQLVRDDFLEELVARGVHYMWYYVYRPAGATPQPEQALTTEQVLELRRFLVDRRHRHPLLLVDAYWDADGKPICPAALGLSHHIAPSGDIEPCPPIQCAAERVLERPLAEAMASDFLKDFRRTAMATTPGCILMEDPAALGAFMDRWAARDSSGRDFRRELAALPVCPGHGSLPEDVPDTHWAYRFGKRYWLFGLGAYG